MAKVEFQRCVVVDGKAYATIAGAQIAILTELFPVEKDSPSWQPFEIAKQIVAVKEQILAAITLTDSSRPSARKAFGATKKSRKSKPTELPGIEPKSA